MRHIWRGFVAAYFDGQRVICAWPDRKHLNDVRGAEADAIITIELNERETAEWITYVHPIQLLEVDIVAPEEGETVVLEVLPNCIEGILEHIARLAADYHSALKWSEEDVLKADMMNRPERWVPVTVEQARAKCRQLGMHPDDVDTNTDFTQRRKGGRRFNVRSSYRKFNFAWPRGGESGKS